MYRIIDSHCHVYPEKIAAKAVAAIGQFYDIPMVFDGRIDTMQKICREAGVTHNVIFSVATTAQQVSSINSFIAATAQASGGTMTGLGTLFPGSEQMEQDVEQIISLGLKGVKLHPDFQKFPIDGEICTEMYELCRGRLPILFHCGDYRYDFSNPNRLKVVLEKYPDLQVVGAHFGGWSLCQTAADQLHGYDNLVVDCSSSFYNLSPETARELVLTYGTDRVLFASDFPMWNPRDNIEVLMKMELQPEDYEKIFHANAERIFGIPPVSP